MSKNCCTLVFNPEEMVDGAVKSIYDKMIEKWEPNSIRYNKQLNSIIICDDREITFVNNGDQTEINQDGETAVLILNGDVKNTVGLFVLGISQLLINNKKIDL